MYCKGIKNLWYVIYTPFNDGAALFEIYIYENRINSVENEKTLAESSLYEELKKKYGNGSNENTFTKSNRRMFSKRYLYS